MARTDFTVNTKDFDINFARITKKRIPESAARAAYIVAAMVISDSILIPPKVPHDKGYLVRSQKVEKPKIESGEISIEEGFDAEYAAAVHERTGAVTWTEPGSGPKYMETKLSEYRDKYMKRWAAEMKEDAK